jgi:ABC-type nitrate/sulfonate/bicarbonate transport system substrate-binding protein
MKRTTRLLSIAMTVAALVISHSALALEKVRTYTQTNYPGFIQFAAKELGLFAKYGIDPDLRFFPSGAPIVQAAAAKEWDIAFLGAPPAVIGSSSLGMVTIGVIYNESAQHMLIGRPGYVTAALANPAALKGAKIFVTTLSTGHFMTEACLRKLGIGVNDVSIIPSDQTASVSAFAAGQGDLVQAWPPFTAALLERGNRVLCDGAQAGARIATVWVSTKEFAAKHPDLVVKWLQANGEAVDWVRQDSARTTEMYRRFLAFAGQTATDETLKETVRTVMTAEPLKDQIKYMTSNDGKRSFVVDMYESIGQFFVRNGRMKEVPDFRPFVDASFLQKATGQ